MGKYRDHRDSRRRGFGDEPVSNEMPEPSYFQQRPRQFSSGGGGGGGGGETVEAEVLWFNADKGFGFVKTTDGQEAYLHIRVLENGGHGPVGEGQKIKAQVEDGQKGKQVTQVFEITGSPRAPAARPPRSGGGAGGFQPRDAGPEQEGEGTVKWYNPDKGFGFIGIPGAEKDIFVHASALTRSGIPGLAEGQRVAVRYGQGQKGLEARSVRLL